MATTTAQEKLNAIQLPNEVLTDRELTVLIFNITGCFYSFAVSVSRKWHESGPVENRGYEQQGFVQLMPHGRPDEGFFDWYCHVRPYEQFFNTKQDCTLHFIFYWNKWVSLGKPNN